MEIKCVNFKITLSFEKNICRFKMTLVQLAMHGSNYGRFTGIWVMDGPADTTWPPRWGGKIRQIATGAGCQTTIADSGRYIHPQCLGESIDFSCSNHWSEWGNVLRVWQAFWFLFGFEFCMLVLRQMAVQHFWTF